MSTKDNDKIPSNEAIINEITKDLESQFSVDDVNTPSEQKNDLEPPGSKEAPDVPQDFDNSDNESEKAVHPDDYIDEVALKDAEITLTDEEKEERHKQSLELKKRGNEEFKSGKYLESVNTYTEALKLCPLIYESDRSVFYANRGASKVKLERTKSAIDDCTKAIELNDRYIRAYFRRAKLYEDTDKLDESLEDYKKILDLDPGNVDALRATHRLPSLINERNEKLKTEMMGKLKDLGNLFLRPFGLSTDNFQLQQDPNSGGYSVNFSQNKN